jgi:hypothetical protein
VVLVGAVLAAVHHAEVVAQRVGEPFGSLVLAAGTVDAGARRHADSPVPVERHRGNSHGGATRLKGAIHLVLFAAFLFLAMFPWLDSPGSSGRRSNAPNRHFDIMAS